MSAYDTRLKDTWRHVPVPGQRVVDAYCQLAKQAAAAATWDDEKLIRSRMEGFRQAVEFYCPSEPGYSSTAGYLIMAADAHMMAQEDE